ncbi:MAG: hypothetical protein WCW14_02885 [Candidatus Paceibacterota bacterium]|jgi:hypothetical protein
MKRFGSFFISTIMLFSLTVGCDKNYDRTNNSGNTQYYNSNTGNTPTYLIAVNVKNQSSHKMALYRGQALVIDNVLPSYVYNVADYVHEDETVDLSFVLYDTDSAGNVIATFFAQGRSFGTNHQNYDWVIQDNSETVYW